MSRKGNRNNNHSNKGQPPQETKIERLVNSAVENILGFNPGSIGVQLSQAETLMKSNRWYLVSNMRQLLSETYVENGLLQAAVDVPVDDAFRGGITVKSKELDDDDIAKLMATMEREGDLRKANQACKWNRLFGGAGIVIISNQDPSTPLDVEKLDPEYFELRAVDMWELFYSQQNTSDYSAAIDGNYLRDVEYYDYYGIKLHKSRVMVMRGIEPPSFVRPRLRGWGLSIIESIIRSINQYLKANNLTFEVLDEFKVDYFKLKDLATTLLSVGGEEAARKRVDLANRSKNYQNAVVLDAEDDFGSKSMDFSGISDTMIGIRMAVASDLRMPLTKLFGVSAAGFSSGQEDIENYNSMVESQVREKIKFDLIKIVQFRCQLLFGFVPEDLDIDFKPLRVLSAEQEENVKSAVFNRLLSAFEKGVISQEQFIQGCNTANLFPMQIDESDIVELAKNQDVDDKASTVPAAGPESSLSAPTVKNASDTPVAFVGLICDGHVLVGRRKDNNLWTWPGGHSEQGETPAQTACREVYEEVGIALDPAELKNVYAKNNLYGYICEIDTREMPHTTFDPDCEFSVMRWVKIDRKTMELLPENRHVKHDVLLEVVYAQS